MKRQLLSLLAAIGLLSSVNAQVGFYTFTQSTGTYTPITGGTVLGDTVSDDQCFVNIAVPLGSTTTTGVGLPIGFNFTYNGIVFNKFAVNANGWISLGKDSVSMQSSSNYTPLSATSTAAPAILRNRIAAFGRDLNGQTGSELRVETIGTSPNKVCVIQWKNYRKYNDATCHYSFQIRLSETSNHVAIVYGIMTNGANSAAPQVGLGGTDNTEFNNRTTTTDWAATTAGTANTATCTLSSTVFPASGQTFTWAPAAGCTGTPTVGTVSAPAAACSGVEFNLSLTTSTVSGLTYHWQSSSTGIAGSFTNLAGATTFSFDTMQTAATWYQCVVTCTASGLSASSNSVNVTMEAASNCYCTSNATSTSDEEILNVTLGTLNNTSTCTTTGGTGSILNKYSNYTSVAAPDLARGASVPFSVQAGTCGSGQYLNLTTIFIDYNQNGSFADAGETVYASAAAINGDHFETGSISIPTTALLGNTRMRVVNMEEYSADTVIKSCGTYGYGETEDYKVNITGTLAGCTGAPTAGTATSSVDSACGAMTINLILSGYSNSSGIMFQWQSSPTGIAGSYTNLVGDTLPTSATTQTATTWYQCVVTCASSSQSATSNSITIFQKLLATCYCISNATHTSDEDIFNVTLGTLNNSSTCTTTGGVGSILMEYSNFTSIAAPNLARTTSVPFSVEVGTCDGNFQNAIKLLIDFNQNGSFSDIGETVYTSVSSTNGAHVETGIISIPLTATLGITRMRVVNKETTQPSSISDCGTYGYGETEDYNVNITGVPPACTGIPTAGTASVSVDTVCNGTSINLTLSGYTSNASGITFQWQSSPTGVAGSYTTIAGGTTQSFATTQTAHTWYQCVVTCTASSQSATSNALSVYQYLLADCYCLPVHSAACSSVDNIDSVRILTTSLMNYGTGCTALNGTAYTVYPASGSTTAYLNKGTPCTLKVTTKSNSIVSVWIDYNQNGIFETGEWTQVCTTSVANVPKTVSITVPLTATDGKTIMRIRSRASGNPNNASSSCTSFGSGETEDYTLTIGTTAGISENSFADFQVYPNPTSGILNVNFKTESTKLNVKLLNVEGQAVYNENVEHFSGTYSSMINMGEKAKGIYFLQITSDNKVTTKKVVLY